MPRSVVVNESGDGQYEELVTVGPHVLRADEGKTAGGGDIGPSPYEYLMAGLGACTVMTLRMYAARHGWLLEKASVSVQHKIVVSTDGNTKADRFERMISLQGNLTDQQRAHLLKIADECPVSQTLQRQSAVMSVLAKAKS